MRKVLMLAGMATLAASLSLGGQEPRWGQAPTRLEVEASQVDLGTISAGTTAVATFHLRNPSDHDVRILAVRPS